MTTIKTRLGVATTDSLFSGLEMAMRVILFAGIGLGLGELADNVPYVNEAIPKAISYIGNAFTGVDTVEQSMNYLVGNLDKISGLLGFIYGFKKH